MNVRPFRTWAGAVASICCVSALAGCGSDGAGGGGARMDPSASAVTSEPAATEEAPHLLGADVVDDPDAELIDVSVSPEDPEVRVGVWRTCLDKSCGTVAIALALTTDGFETRVVPEDVWRAVPIVEVAPSGQALVVTWRSKLSLEIVRPDGSVSEVRRTGEPAAVGAGELVGGVVPGRRVVYFATDPETAVAHPVPVPDQTSQLIQTPSGQLRATTLGRGYAWSDDGGMTWQRSAGAVDDTLLHLMADSTPDVHVLLGGGDGATLFPFDEVRRLDDPDSWSVVQQSGDERAYLGGAAVLPDGRLLLDVDEWSSKRPAGLYVSQGGNWASFDRVLTGSPFNGKPDDVRLLDLRVENNTTALVAVGPDGLSAWSSNDAGATWTALAAR